MRILVCVKQVFDTETRISIDEGGKTYSLPSSTVYRINQYDEHALEAALALQDALPGTTVDAVSAGPPRVETVLRRALEMGASESFHIALNDESAGDPDAVSTAIASFVRGRPYDLILAGVMSEDLMQCQTGPMIAEKLGIPWATSALSIAPDTSCMKAAIVREIDAGASEELTLTLPLLVTVQSGINRPRYPTLTSKLRARNAVITVFNTAVDGGRRTEVVESRIPRSTRQAIVFQGSVPEKAAALAAFLRERSGV